MKGVGAPSWLPRLLDALMILDRNGSLGKSDILGMLGIHNEREDILGIIENYEWGC